MTRTDIGQMDLDSDEMEMLLGGRGPAAKFCMEIVTGFAVSVGARRLLPISSAHIDGCLYLGEVSLDFISFLSDGGGRVKVPTTLNVGGIDLIHPELMLQSAAELTPARRLMEAHVELGCMPTFTCAPYQTMFRPRFGDQIAWGESNAIVFANSVIGARTNRYGDFIDLCCAITGRAPAWGLHLDENRRGQLLFRLDGFGDALEPSDTLYTAMGLLIGEASGALVPVIQGLPTPRDEDQLKALGAASASAGAVALFHVIGVTPEAPSFEEAFQPRGPFQTVSITPADIERATASLSGVLDGTPVSAICLGTPHFSRQEWMKLIDLVQAVGPERGIPIYVNTSRDLLKELEAINGFDRIIARGVVPVVDTCTYVTSIVRELDGAIMTNSGKWAHYAPGNLKVNVAFGELSDCVLSAASGRVSRAGA